MRRRRGAEPEHGQRGRPRGVRGDRHGQPRQLIMIDGSFAIAIMIDRESGSRRGILMSLDAFFTLNESTTFPAVHAPEHVFELLSLAPGNAFPLPSPATRIRTRPPPPPPKKNPSRSAGPAARHLGTAKLASVRTRAPQEAGLAAGGGAPPGGERRPRRRLQVHALLEEASLLFFLPLPSAWRTGRPPARHPYRPAYMPQGRPPPFTPFS